MALAGTAARSTVLLASLDVRRTLSRWSLRQNTGLSRLRCLRGRAAPGQYPPIAPTRRADTVHPRCARVPCWPARTRKGRCINRSCSHPPIMEPGRRGQERSKALPVRPAGETKVKIKIKSGMVGPRPPPATLRAAHDRTASDKRRGKTRHPQPVSSASGLQRRAPRGIPGHRQRHARQEGTGAVNPGARTS
jgi:hypothetical protein